MPLRSDPLDELAIPDATTVEEHDLVTDGDVFVGGQSTVEFGVRGHNVVAGERVTFGGHIEAEGDCRLDMWSDVAEDVLVGEDAYLGERVTIGGELKVAGNLDIGDDVDIEEGFEANGWITIRNPMPTIVFLVVYLSQLLRIGEEEAAEELASELLEAEDSDDQPLVIPRSARVSDETWRVSTPATVGDDCRIHGNLRAESVTVGTDTTVFGSLRAKDDVEVGADTEVKGDVTTRNGDVRIDRGAHVWGDISADDVALHEHAVVEGTIRVSGELTQLRDPLGPEPRAEDEPSDEDHTSDAGEADTVDDGTTEAVVGADTATDAEGDAEADADVDADADADADADGDAEANADAATDADADADDEGTGGQHVESMEIEQDTLDGIVKLPEVDDHHENGHGEEEATPDAD